jgi:hypothetical protein
MMKGFIGLASATLISVSFANASFAGGKTVTGSPTSVQPAVQSASLKVKYKITLQLSFSLTSEYVASIVEQLRADYARELGIDADVIDIQVDSAS